MTGKDMSAFREAVIAVYGECEIVWDTLGNGGAWPKVNGKVVQVLTGDDPADFKQRLKLHKQSLDTARRGLKSGGVTY